MFFFKYKDKLRKFFFLIFVYNFFFRYKREKKNLIDIEIMNNKNGIF